MRKVIAQKEFKPGDCSDDVTPGQIIPIGNNGASFIRKLGGSIEYFAPEINTVGIRDIADVLEHRINTIVGSRLHMVRFVNGGLLTYAYNDAGQLIELASSGLSANISTNNEMVFYVEREPSSDQAT